MTLTVGRIPYLHAEPFYCDMERRGLVLYEMVPSALAGAITDGDIDAGPIPVVDCFRLAESLDPVAGFFVAPGGATGRIFLFFPKTNEKLHNAPIRGTGETRPAGPPPEV